MRWTCGPRTTTRVRPLGSPGCSSSWTASESATLRSSASEPSTASAQAATARRAATSRMSGAKRAVGEAQVERRRARVAAELQVRELGDLEAGRRALGDRALDQRLVAQSPARRTNGSATILSLSACSPSAPDSIEASTQCSPRRSQRPVLAHPHRLGELAVALDVPAAASRRRKSRSLASIRTTTRSRSCRRARGAGCRRTRPSAVADGLDHVAPALALEVVESSLPLDQQLRRDQPAQRDAVVRPTRRSGCRRTAAWRRRGRCRARRSDSHPRPRPRPARRGARACGSRAGARGPAAACARQNVRKRREAAASRSTRRRTSAEQHEQAEAMRPSVSDVEQRRKMRKSEERPSRRRRRSRRHRAEAAATAAEAGGAAACGGAARRRRSASSATSASCDQECAAVRSHRLIRDQPAAAALSGPTPGSVWATCWSAW